MQRRPLLAVLERPVGVEKGHAVGVRHILWLALLGVLNGGSLWAADPWKSNKKYTEWSEKEIRKVLEKSPWAKTVTLTFLAESWSGQGAGGGPPLADQPIQVGRGGRGAPLISGGGGPRTAGRQVLVRWESALPVRRALDRQQVQAGNLTPEQAEQYFEQAPSEYEVVLGGTPMVEMTDTTLEEVKASTYLKTGDKQRITAQDVRVSQLPEESLAEGQVPNLYFAFPRATPIELRQKSVEFFAEVGQFKIKKKFKLKDMLFKGKLEL